MSIRVRIRSSQEMLPVLAEYERQMDDAEGRAYHSFRSPRPAASIPPEPAVLCFPNFHPEEDRATYRLRGALAGFEPRHVEVVVGPQDMVIRAQTAGPKGLALKAVTHCRFPEPVHHHKLRADFLVGELRVSVPKAIPSVPQ